MIERISVRNFILVDSLELDFTAGFNVLSGETGAGKSILVGALSLLCGGRAAADLVRSGSEEAMVAGEFRVANHPECLAWLRERDIEPDDGVVLVRRSLKTTGRGTIYMQAVPLSRADLEEFSSLLLDLHSQHEHQSLFNEASHRRLLDRYADLEERVTAFGQNFATLGDLQQQLQQIVSREEGRLREIEFLRFAIEEIDAAGVDSEEMPALESERERMMQYEKLVEHMESARNLVEGDSTAEVSAPSLLLQFRQVRQEIHGAARLDSSLQENAERLDGLYFEVEDALQSINSYRESLVYDPARLDVIEERLAVLRGLSRKYGGSLEAVIAYRGSAEQSLEDLLHAEESKAELRSRIRQLEQEILRDAREIHQRRDEAGRALQEKIGAVLKDLAMNQARFVVEVEARTNDAGKMVCGSHGADRVSFLITTNTGEPPRPLSRVASGGELSRVMLAIKTVLAAADNVRSLLFDEIDTGIGGAVALAMASHMRALSDHGQVICISHLATIAVHADNHIAVVKDSPGERTVIRAATLSGEDRVREVARMLAGDGEEQHSLEHARALLQRYRRKIDGQDQ